MHFCIRLFNILILNMLFDFKILHIYMFINWITFQNFNRLWIISFISKTSLCHKMLSPTSLSHSNILMTKRTSISLTYWFPWQTILSFFMFLKYINLNTFIASLTFFKILFILTLSNHMIIQGWNFYNLSAWIAICKH